MPHGAVQLSVHPPSSSEKPDSPRRNDAADDGVQSAWSALLAAREERRGRGADAPDTRLLIRADDGWAAADGLPPPVRALFDLYLPVCNASAEKPQTVAHLGQSLDGYIATASGDSYYVTGPQNVMHLHRMRALSGAVIVGAETVSMDDPQLTVRHASGPNPVRVVLDPRRRLANGYRVFSDGEAPTLLICAADRIEEAEPRHGRAEVVGISAPGGRLALDALLEVLHERGIFSVFVEGGGATVSHFLQAELLDRLQIAVAPLVTGHGRPGIRVVARHHIAECLRPANRVFRMGNDVLFDCDLRAGDLEAPAEGLPREALSRVY